MGNIRSKKSAEGSKSDESPQATRPHIKDLNFKNHGKAKDLQAQKQQLDESAVEEMGAQSTPTTHDHKLKSVEFMKAETLRDKHASFIPGVGEKLAGKLAGKGFTKATQVVGQYLVVDGDERKFKDWIKSCDDNAKSEKVYNAVKEWCNQHMKI